ncbi:2-dehydro-3-deoxygalactonokinase [Sphingopyxis sp.]|uniref:2-dehydro-3-deoxygalactonokinase n=1 Tax=Sphingopyxis sp. TaxID=1908224 RepID=UPI002ED82E4F
MTMIGIDWGTTNLRAWRFAGDGSVAEMRRGATGIGAMQGRDFARLLHSKIGDWLDGDSRVILGGMIGSRNGWREIPYLACPASLGGLAAGALAVELAGASAQIAPGLHCRTADGGHDVMRGEEVQLLGAGIADGLVVLPGTHSKWARVDGGAITGFRTFMTGELFALLARHSFLAQSIDGEAPDAGAFAKGVDRALADPAITSLLFTVRTEGLFDEIAPTALADYLSGLLIGAEVARGIDGADGPIAIIAEAALADRYAAAFARAGIADTKKIDGNDAAAAGLWAIGSMTDWSRT